MESLGTESSSPTWQWENHGEQAAGSREVGCSILSPALAHAVQGPGRGAEPSLVSPPASPWGGSSPNPHRSPLGLILIILRDEAQGEPVGLDGGEAAHPLYQPEAACMIRH